MVDKILVLKEEEVNKYNAMHDKMVELQTQMLKQKALIEAFDTIVDRLVVVDDGAEAETVVPNTETEEDNI